MAHSLRRRSVENLVVISAVWASKEPVDKNLKPSFQTDEQEVINFLLTTEIIPLCLRIMESGSELSKTVCCFSPNQDTFRKRVMNSVSRTPHLSCQSLQVATFILQKILLDETGLSYICQTYERFSHVAMILVRTLCTSLQILCYFLSVHTRKMNTSRSIEVHSVLKLPSIRTSVRSNQCHSTVGSWDQKGRE